MPRHIRLFPNHTDYEEYRDSDEYILPNISVCKEENDTHFNYYPPIVAKFNVTSTSNSTMVPI